MNRFVLAIRKFVIIKEKIINAHIFASEEKEIIVFTNSIESHQRKESQYIVFQYICQYFGEDMGGFKPFDELSEKF